MQRIKTDRLILRQWDINDADDLLEFGKSKSVERAGWKPLQSIDESKQLIQASVENDDSWAVTLKDSGKVIGWILLGDTRRYDRYKEIEFIISDEYQNFGYATEAVKSVLKYVFETLDLLVVAVCHYPENVQSKRVIEKCGFTYEGTLRKFSRNLSDSIRYSILKEEWERGCVRKCALIFIDGTICDDRHRLSLYGTSEFCKADNIMKDSPVAGSVKFLCELSKRYNLIYIGARTPDLYDITKRWLDENGFPDGELYLTATQAERLVLAANELKSKNIIVGIGDRWDDNQLHLELGCKSIIVKEYSGDWNNVMKHLPQ